MTKVVKRKRLRHLLTPMSSRRLHNFCDVFFILLRARSGVSVRHSPPRRHASIMPLPRVCCVRAATRAAHATPRAVPRVTPARLVRVVRLRRVRWRAAQLHDARSQGGGSPRLCWSRRHPRRRSRSTLSRSPPPRTSPSSFPAGPPLVSGSIRFESALNSPSRRLSSCLPPRRSARRRERRAQRASVAGDRRASFNPEKAPAVGSPSSRKKVGASACHFVGAGASWNRRPATSAHVADAVAERAGRGMCAQGVYVSLDPKKREASPKAVGPVRARADD